MTYVRHCPTIMVLTSKRETADHNLRSLNDPPDAYSRNTLIHNRQDRIQMVDVVSEHNAHRFVPQTQ